MNKNSQLIIKVKKENEKLFLKKPEHFLSNLKHTYNLLGILDTL